MPSVYSFAAAEELQYYVQIDDCLAQCAAEFGGGRRAFADLGLLDLLRWTHRAIERERLRIELAVKTRGI